MNIRGTWHLFNLGVLLFVTALTAVGGGKVTVKFDLALPLFLKVASYDDSFQGGKQFDSVKVYVLYDPAQAVSCRQTQEAEKYFRENSQLKVLGTPCGYQALPLADADSVLNSVGQRNYSILVVTSLAYEKVKPLLQAIERMKVRTFAIDSEQVKEGLAVGLKVDDKATTIIVNMEAAKLEGSKFSAHLLKICELYNN